MTSAALDSIVHCPRCGYDLRGTMATWRQSCPLDGTCAECGLGFQWIDVIKPDRVPPRWCVEHAPRRTFPYAMLLTVAMASRPWQFWSRIKMSHEVRPRRLIVFATLLLATFVGVVVLAQASAAAFIRVTVDRDLAIQLRKAQAVIASADAPVTVPAWNEQWIRDRYPEDRIEDELARALENQQSQREYQLAWARRYIVSPTHVDRSMLWCIAEAVILPFAFTSRARIVTEVGRENPYHAPVTVIPLSINMLRVGLNAGAFVNGASLPLLVVVTVPFILPATLVLLPISRRRAKVRWAHIGRVFAYSLSVQVILLHLVSAMILADALYFSAGTLTAIAVLMLLLLPGLALLIWWWAGLSRYLRLPHALPVAAVHLLMSILLVLACIWLVIPDWIVPGPW